MPTVPHEKGKVRRCETGLLVLSKPSGALRISGVDIAKTVSLHPSASALAGIGNNSRTRRVKHWDRHYVQSLEDQVRLRPKTAEAEYGSDVALPMSSPPPGKLPYSDRARHALQQMSSSKWTVSTLSGQREALFNGPGKFSILSNKTLPVFELEHNPEPSKLTPADITAFLEDIKPNTSLKRVLKERFVDCINPCYKFVDPTWLQFSDEFPENDAALQLLYGAVFAASAYSIPETTTVSKSMARGFLAFAESNIQHCYLEHLCLPVLQALLILAWLKHSMLDTRRGDLYKHMAIGLSGYLGIPEAPLSQGTPHDAANLGTFWCLYLIDRNATARLGCPSSIPWDVGQIPRYVEVMSKESVDMASVAFEHNCRLTWFQQRYVEVMYTARFDGMTASEKLEIHSQASSALVSFRREVDERLYLTRRHTPHRTQIMFWIAYHAVTINLHRPMLDPTNQGTAQVVEACLRSATSAAESITQLARRFGRLHGLSEAPPCLATHLLRAALVHAIGVVAFEGRASKAAARRFWECMQGLGEVKGSWSTLAGYYMRFLVGLMEDWGVESEALSRSARKKGLTATLETLMPEVEEMH